MLKKTKWPRIFHTPWLHFILLGFALFAFQDWYWPEEKTAVATELIGEYANTIIITRVQIEELKDNFKKTTGSLPTPAELKALINQEVYLEIMAREALRLGMDKNERAIDNRLIIKMNALSDDPNPDPDELLKQARALELDRDDVVVRRALIHKMKMFLEASPSRKDFFTKQELEDYLQGHQEEFMIPERIGFKHIFFDMSKHGDHTRDDALEVYEQIHSNNPPDNVDALGDPFILSRKYGGLSQKRITEIMGADFAKQIGTLKENEWSKPVLSAYGWHLVYVFHKAPAFLPELSEVQEKIMYELKNEREEKRMRERLSLLRKKYEVKVEGEVEVEGKEEGKSNE